MRTSVRRFALAAAPALIALPVLAAPGASAAARGPNHIAFHMGDHRIDESSGLAASIRFPGVTYTHNDSGDSARVFAVGPNGKTRAELRLAGFVARDWEAIGMGRDGQGRPAVYVADTGDNLGGAWPNVAVFRFPEPSGLTDRSVHATRFRMKYADGPRNAEAIMIDPRDNRLYVISKEWNGGIYRAPKHLRADRMNILHRVGDAPSMATDASYAPDGSSFVIRTYFSAQFYDRIGHAVTTSFLPSQKQGESITYERGGRSLLIGSEGRNSPVWRIPVPDGLRPKPAPKPTNAAQPGKAAPKDGGGGNSTLTGLVIVLAIAAVVVFVVRRRRG
ncbi:MAG TPA: hypothetical protein VGL93_25270 [Streptosporangiaceae bacterium]